MPERAPTHSEQQGRQSSDRAYKQQARWVEEERLYGSQRWKRLRQRVLKRAPLCVDPYGWHAEDGRYVLATQVDHIVPLRSNGALAFVEANLQGLCARCHAVKTKRQP